MEPKYGAVNYNLNCEFAELFQAKHSRDFRILFDAYIVLTASVGHLLKIAAILAVRLSENSRALTNRRLVILVASCKVVYARRLQKKMGFADQNFGTHCDSLFAHSQAVDEAIAKCNSSVLYAKENIMRLMRADNELSVSITDAQGTLLNQRYLWRKLLSAQSDTELLIDQKLRTMERWLKFLTCIAVLSLAVLILLVGTAVKCTDLLYA